MSIGEVWRRDAEAYFASPAGVQLASKGRSSTLYPLHLVAADVEVATYHFWRFVLGATDDHALAGWGVVMSGRQEAARVEGRRFEIAIAAGNGKTA